MGEKINYPGSERKPVQYFSLRYSCPVWLVESLFNEYGREVAEQLLQQQMGRPPLTLRVNPLKTTKEELSIQLEEQGFTLKPHLMENCVEVLDGGSLADTALFEQGMFHVQDVASQLCGQVVAAYHPDSVLDVCAAPGGKTFTIAEELKDTVPITACDLHEHRVKLIKSGAKRLGLSSVHAQVSDASIYHEKIGKFGLVLCDVPCSGFGVIRRKPEIKYKSEQSVEGLPKIQMNILEIASQYVKAGGVLIYSTCTLSKRENQEVTKAFLLQHPEFSPLQLPEVLTQFYPHAGYDLTFLPNQLDSDGFYLCAMKKKGNYSLIDIKSLTYQQLAQVMEQKGQPNFRTKQIFEWLHKRNVSDFGQMTNLSAQLREELSAEFYLNCLKIKKKLVSRIDDDGKIFI